MAWPAPSVTTGRTTRVSSRWYQEQRQAIVKLKSETDFVAASDLVQSEAGTLAKLVIADGEAAVPSDRGADDLKITLKEKIELGDVVIEAAPGNVSTATCTCRVAVGSTPCWSRWPMRPGNCP